ncbi:MAG: cytosolic protein [Candidatus Hydrogenedentes bacterium]|nr:cytosolic protein [Candidatus Hydrogenedentota bacterium]
MSSECPKQAVNMSRCTCSYPGCPNHATCCDCLHSHLVKKQLPACCFPEAAEKTYDRSFAMFAKSWNL